MEGTPARFHFFSAASIRRNASSISALRQARLTRMNVPQPEPNSRPGVKATPHSFTRKSSSPSSLPRPLKSIHAK